MKKSLCLLISLCLVVSGLVLLAACSQSKKAAAVKSGNEYTIVSAYDDVTHMLSAVQTVSVTNRSDNAFDAVKFHIYANQYRQDATNSVVPAVYHAKAYPNGDSYGDISFDSVKVDGEPVPFTVGGTDCDILSVPVGDKFYPDKTVDIEMTYTVQLANVLHRLGYNDKTVNLGNWYPVLCHVDNGKYTESPYFCVGDPFVTDTANYTVSITLPDKYLVASTGDLTEAASSGNSVTYRYRAEAVRDFAMVLSSEFTKISDTVGDTQVNYFYYADTDPESSLAAACGMLEYLNKHVGTYPYDQYSVAETGFCYGGMEYPNLAMVTSGSASYREAVAHETAHQWFYGVVGNDQISEAWLDEGLSEYVTYLYMDSTGETALSQSMRGCIKTYVTYVDVLDRFYDNVDRTMRPIDLYKNDNEYVIFTYVKGSLLFNSLYETVGADKFWKSLHTYYDQAQFTVAPGSQLIQCFASACGDEAASIFSTFIDGKEIIGKVTD